MESTTKSLPGGALTRNADTAAFEVLAAAQFTDLLQLSRDAVYQFVAIVSLPGRKVGRTWRFSKEGIEQYVRGRDPGRIPPDEPSMK